MREKQFKKQPLVTVLMSVYNGESYLRQAIDSILSQSFKDFEFLIINDGSTDGTNKILKSYSDSRIKVVNSKQNKGLIFSLNKGLGLSKGKYIARMDADDISLPGRLKSQVSYMENHSEMILLGTYVRIFTRIPGIGITPKFPVDSDKIKATLLFDNVIQHPSVMLRKIVLDRHKLRYSGNFRHIEDYEYWTRLSDYGSFAILPEVLLNYRLHAGQVGQKYGNKQLEGIKKLRKVQLGKLKVSATDSELNLHYDICSGKIRPTLENITDAEKWLLKIGNCNNRSKVYEKSALANILGQKWFEICNQGVSLRSQIWKKYWGSPLSRHYRLSPAQVRYFWLESSLLPFARPAMVKFRNYPIIKKILLAK